LFNSWNSGNTVITCTLATSGGTIVDSTDQMLLFSPGGGTPYYSVINQGTANLPAPDSITLTCLAPPGITAQATVTNYQITALLVGGVD
jgi:hypothetical protein